MALYDFSRVGNLCQTTLIGQNFKTIVPIPYIVYFTILEKCFIRSGTDANNLTVNNVNPTDITVSGVACADAADFRAKMAAMLLIAAGGGGDITGSGAATQLAVFTAVKNILGYVTMTYQDTLYPSLTLGAAGQNGFALLMRTAAGDYSAIGSFGGLLLQSGTQTYPVEVYIKAARVVSFSNNTGVDSGESNAGIMDANCQIVSGYKATGGLDKGAFHLERTINSGGVGNNHHGFVDKTTFQTGTAAFNSFYAQGVAGNNDADPAHYQGHYAGFQTRFQKVGTNRIDKFLNFVALADLIDDGEVTERYGFYFYDANNAGGGGLKKQWGVYIAPLFNGTEKNVGIYSGAPAIIGESDTPDSSAMLQVESTTKGFLPPRMTGAQAEGIPAPVDGLLIYCNNGNGVTINSTGWWGFQGVWKKATFI